MHSWTEAIRSGHTQGADRSGKGIKYKAADGSLLEFKQVGSVHAARAPRSTLQVWTCCLMLTSFELPVARGWQVLLTSKALEVSVENALVSGLSHEHAEGLTNLFSVFLPSVNASSLASQLVRLATLLVDEAPDTLGAAQRAVHGTLASLKAGTAAAGGRGDSDAVSAWLSRIDHADKEIRKQEGLLQKLHATSGGVVTK